MSNKKIALAVPMNINLIRVKIASYSTGDATCDIETKKEVWQANGKRRMPIVR